MDSYDVNKGQWLNMWGKLCRGSAGISGFPDWVKILGHMFFDIIDRDGDGILSYNEIKMFYAKLIGIEEKNLEKFSTEAYRAMTAVRKNFIFFKVVNLILRIVMLNISE